MKIDLNLKSPIIYQYEGEIQIKREQYKFDVYWNDEEQEVVHIDWTRECPKDKLMIAERRITQLVSKVIKEDAKLIII